MYLGKDKETMECVLKYIQKIPFRNYWRVWWWSARHWRRPTTRHILLDDDNLRLGGGDSSEYT